MDEVKLTPCKAIHLFCLQCVGGQKQIRGCETNDCPLFAYRFGKNPSRKGIGGQARTHKRGKKQQYIKIIPTQVKEMKLLEAIVDSKKKILITIKDVEEE